MPEREDSDDSFDDFFGVTKTDDKPRKASPTPAKKTESSVTALIKAQPLSKRPETPSTLEERVVTPVKSKPKVTPNELPVTSNGTKNIVQRPPSTPKRVESVQSKVYESDFDDDDNAYEDEQQSTPERKQYSSEPAKKDRVSEVRRRGSDSEVKSSYTVAPRRHKSNNATVQRRDPQLPYIRPAQTRRAVVNPTRRPRESATSSIKTGDLDKRAASARNDKLKLMEGQVAALRRQLEDQRIENSTLRTIQRREEKAIKKYEEKEYDIHRIVRDYNQEIDHIKQVLINERETKMRLEKQMEARDEKLREQTKRLKQFEKIVHEKNLDERYELREKLNETDKKLQEYQEKLATHEKYIENLEKNHRHEIKQELARQRDLKRELEKRSEKYNDLQLKFEDKARQIDTMHIYAQRGGKRPSDSPSNLSKSRSLQSLNDTSPRLREKMNNYDRKRPDQERKPRLKLEPPSSVDDSSSKSDKKKLTVKKDPPAPSTKQNGHGAPKGKPPTRRLSTPESIEEEKLGGDDDGTLLASKSKKAPATLSMQRDEQLLSPAQIHKRAPAPQPKYTSSGTTAGEGSSIFKLTEAPTPAVKAAPLKPRAKLDLDEKWSDMFGSSKQEDSAKEDLLSKLIADEQLERRAAATTQPSTNASQRVSMTTFEPSTRPTKVQPAADPFDSLFGGGSTRPTAVNTRANDFDDMFSNKPSTQVKTQSKTDPFDSLFGSSTSNDKMQRAKVVTNPVKSIPNRTMFDEVEDFVI